jgi:hypothetical protein
MTLNPTGQTKDNQQDLIFSSYLGPPADYIEDEENQFLKYVDAIAKVAFVNGIVALVLTYFAKGTGRPGIGFAIAYFLGVFLGLLVLPTLLPLTLALPGLFFNRYRQVFKIISFLSGSPRFFSFVSCSI